MQGYAYSVFSLAAIAIHLMVNIDLLGDRAGAVAVRGIRYRGFLVGILAYYVTDAAWGLLAGLGWTDALYVDTVLYFVALVAFVVMWCRFVVFYVGLGRGAARMFAWLGGLLMAATVAMLALNVSNDTFFYFDEQGMFVVGERRLLYFSFLVAFNVLLASFVLAKAFGSRGSARGRNMIVFLHCVTMTVTISLQVFWPLTPFTSLGCLIGNCFLHVFIIRDRQTALHMAALERALERARAAEKSRSLFFSIVSHDIRTPLNAILGYSELLQNGIDDQAGRAEALNAIRASGTTLLELVNDVLDLAKMDAGKIVLRPEPVRLDRLARDVFATFSLAASGKGVRLVNDTAGVPTLLLDGHRFRQILFNLVGNAVKFTDSGSVTASATYDGENLEVSVSDTGCGIEPEMQSRVLDPFVQVVDPTHSADRAHGTGLGLSICRRLVEVMGGRLSVASEPGKGSTFCITLPNVKAAENGTGAPATPANHPTTQPPRRVLVVDDSQVNRLVLKAFLKKAGVAAVDFAGDGLEALAALDAAAKEGRAHDLVLTDYWMPNMNGGELIERVRADGRFRDLPVFAVTADTEFHNDERFALFTGVLLKPLTYDKLMDVF